MERPRVLFVARTIVHFSLFETIVTALITRGAEVEILFNESESQHWKKGDLTVIKDYTEAHPELKVGWILKRADRWRRFIFCVRELRTYRSYLKRPDTTPFYIQRARRILDHVLPPAWKERLKGRVIERLVTLPTMGFWLRAAERLTPIDEKIADFIRERRPNVLLFSPLNMRFSEETDYLKAAKHLRIPSVLHTLTWDNLSTKGLIQLLPDQVCVWNELQRRDATRIHGVPPSLIKVTGSPFFDPWFERPHDLLGRDQFCQSIGFDPAKKILLYLGSSANIAADETWFVETIRDALDASQDPVVRDCQLLVRPHFANHANYQRLSRPNLVVWPKAGALPERRTDMRDMQSSLYHAAAAVGINSSAMIISVLVGLPTFSVHLPQYWQTQSDSTHFQNLVSFDAIDYLADINELGARLAEVLRGNDSKKNQRLDFARRFARPMGLERSAGDVVAEAVLAMARDRPGTAR
jgi:hypothetical protein